MKEVEILVEVNETKEKVLEKLNNYEFVGTKRTIDTYYYDPLRDNLKPKNLSLKECFRTRIKGDKNYITYKVDNFAEDGTWIYSDEYETEIKDMKAITDIVSHLGLKELVKIDSTKNFFNYENYEIEFETVENLGNFLEVEYQATEDFSNVLEVKNKIRKFINNLGFDVKEVNMGKPELMLRKLNK